MNEGVGVVVARFQVPSLTAGHREILDYVLSKGHNLNVIILGVTETKCTRNNPLDFDARRRMLEETYPGRFVILFQKDNYSDKVWAQELDQKISDIANGRAVTLYGSRDSFAKHYFGKYPVEEYKQKLFCSGTEERELTGKQVQGSAAWRAGVCWATQNQFPSVYPTVDAAIFEKVDNNPFEYIYMGKKSPDRKYQFIGGFTDPSDSDYESAAAREVLEETGMEVMGLGYIGSAKIDDWRYASEPNKIITSFFAFQYVFGKAKPSDDMKELYRLKFADLKEEDIQPEHRALFKMLKGWVVVKGLQNAMLD